MTDEIGQIEKLAAAALFIRSELADLDGDPTDAAMLEAIAGVLDAASTGDPHALAAGVDVMADALLAMKEADDRQERIREQVHAEHGIVVATVEKYLYRWECACGNAGDPTTSKGSAGTAGLKHVHDEVGRRVREETAPAVA